MNECCRDENSNLKTKEHTLFWLLEVDQPHMYFTQVWHDEEAVGVFMMQTCTVQSEEFIYHVELTHSKKKPWQLDNKQMFLLDGGRSTLISVWLILAPLRPSFAKARGFSFSHSVMVIFFFGRVLLQLFQ